MPGSIGSLNAFDSWRGQFQAPAKPVEIYTRAGTAGTGISVGAAHGIPLQVETTFYGTSTDCATHISSAEGMVGTVVSATDAIGKTYANTGVIAVEKSLVRVKGHATKTHLAMLTWTLVPEAS